MPYICAMITEREKYLKYHSSTLAKKRRAARNAARRSMIKKYGKAAMKGKDVGHKNNNLGGNLSNSPGNLTVQSTKYNRGKDANLWRTSKKKGS